MVAGVHIAVAAAPESLLGVCDAPAVLPLLSGHAPAVGGALEGEGEGTRGPIRSGAAALEVGLATWDGELYKN